MLFINETIGFSGNFFLVFNSLAQQLKNLNKGVIFGDISITILLYADDIILLAETKNNLQDLLN